MIEGIPVQISSDNIDAKSFGKQRQIHSDDHCTLKGQALVSQHYDIRARVS